MKSCKLGCPEGPDESRNPNVPGPSLTKDPPWLHVIHALPHTRLNITYDRKMQIILNENEANSVLSHTGTMGSLKVH